MRGTITLLLVFISLTLQAQSKYEQGMIKAFQLWEENKLDEASNLFEGIAIAEPAQWLPDYYVAQMPVLKCWNAWEDRDETMLKANLDKAQEFINNIKTKAPEELYAKQMQAQVYTVWVAHDGMKYGMKYSGSIGQIYKVIEKVAPENPIFYTQQSRVGDWGSALFWNSY